MPYLEHLTKLHLDLCSPRYSNSPQLSCLGMNPGRGWNPYQEESYLPKYIEYEAETFTQGTYGFYLRSMKMLVPEPSSIMRYSECTKTTSFSIFGFFRLEIKLGFDFLEVLLNQKLRPWSINFDFQEDINPILGSLKNSTSVKIPNFPQQKTKNARNQILLLQKDAPFNGELA